MRYMKHLQGEVSFAEKITNMNTTVLQVRNKKSLRATSSKNPTGIGEQAYFT